MAVDGWVPDRRLGSPCFRPPSPGHPDRANHQNTSTPSRAVDRPVAPSHGARSGAATADHARSLGAPVAWPPGPQGLTTVVVGPAPRAPVRGVRRQRAEAVVAERDPGARPTGAVPEGQPAGQDAGAELADVRARLERAEALVEHAPDAIVILDVDLGRFVWVNAAAEQLFGMDREALLRIGPVEVSPPVQPDGRRSETAAREYLARAIAGARPRFEWLHRRTDGRDVPCEVTLLRLPAADQRLVRGSVLEITERREAERARQDADAAQAARRAAEANAARLQAMVAGLNAIVWERDPDTLRIRFINQRAEELLGYPTAQWLEDDGLAERIIHPDDHDRALEAVRSAVAEGSDFSLSYRVRAADGRWLWLQHLGHVDRDEDGAGRALHAVLIDVTESRRREQAAALLAAARRVLARRGRGGERPAAGAPLPGGGPRVGYWPAAAAWRSAWPRSPNSRSATSATGPVSGCAKATGGTARWP